MPVVRGVVLDDQPPARGPGRRGMATARASRARGPSRKSPGRSPSGIKNSSTRRGGLASALVDGRIVVPAYTGPRRRSRRSRRRRGSPRRSSVGGVATQGAAARPGSSGELRVKALPDQALHAAVDLHLELAAQIEGPARCATESGHLAVPDDPDLVRSVGQALDLDALCRLRLPDGGVDEVVKRILGDEGGSPALPERRTAARRRWPHRSSGRVRKSGRPRPPSPSRSP